MEYATNFENLTTEKTFAEVNKIEKTKKLLKCYSCGIVGHISTECRKKNKTVYRGENSRTPKSMYEKNRNQLNKKQDQKGDHNKKLKCYRCQLPGHIAKNCRVRSVNMIELNAMQLEFVPDNESERKVPKGTYAVANPFEVNNIEVNPIHVEAKNYEKLIVVDVEVEIKNKNEVASAVLDSASTISTLSSFWYQSIA